MRTFVGTHFWVILKRFQRSASLIQIYTTLLMWLSILQEKCWHTNQLNGLCVSVKHRILTQRNETMNRLRDDTFSLFLSLLSLNQLINIILIVLWVENDEERVNNSYIHSSNNRMLIIHCCVALIITTERNVFLVVVEWVWRLLSKFRSSTVGQNSRPKLNELSELIHSNDCPYQVVCQNAIELDLEGCSCLCWPLIRHQNWELHKRWKSELRTVCLLVKSKKEFAIILSL
jgi:hypothetical protein